MIRFALAVVVGAAFLWVHVASVRRVISRAERNRWAWGTLALVVPLAAPAILLRPPRPASAPVPVAVPLLVADVRLAVLWLALAGGYAGLALLA